MMKDRYTVLHRIAEGGFGRVSLAFDRETGKNVAIKELINFDGDGFSRFVNEYRILYEHIDNQYVVDVIDADFDANPPYIVLEFCEQGSLRKWVEDRKPWQVVVFALSCALQGLEGIHRLGGFHRDLKPENLLIANDSERDFVIKVADFGHARVQRPLSPPITTHAAGTRGYIAPEVLIGSSGFHAGADIFSLGIVALELLTGGKDAAALGKMNIPASLRELVLQMISADRTKRPNVQNIASRLADIMRLPELASPPSSTVANVAPVSPPNRPSVNSVPAPVKPAAATPAAPRPSKGPGLGTLVVGAAAVAGLIGLLGKLATNDATWDESVQRRRGSDGRFKKGSRPRRR